MSDALRDVARAWRRWLAAEARIGKDYGRASPQAQERLLAAHGQLRDVLDATLKAVDGEVDDE